jgi:hypothetical protein
MDAIPRVYRDISLSRRTSVHVFPRAINTPKAPCVHTATNAKTTAEQGLSRVDSPIHNPQTVQATRDMHEAKSCDEKGSPSWHYKTYGRAPEPYTRLFSDSKSMRTCDCTIQVESFLPAHVDRSAISVFLQAKALFCDSDFPRVPALRSSLAVAATRCPAVSVEKKVAGLLTGRWQLAPQFHQHLS